MKLKYAVILLMIFSYIGCAKEEVQHQEKTGISHTIEQIKNIEIAHIESETLSEGDYIGEFPFTERFLYKVKVTIKSGMIADIEVLENGTENEYAKKGLAVIPRMLQKQSPKVDVVSGATVTSKALMKCVEKALRKAE